MCWTDRSSELVWIFSNVIEILSQICIAVGVNSFDAKYLQAIILLFCPVYLSQPQYVKAFNVEGTYQHFLHEKKKSISFNSQTLHADDNVSFETLFDELSQSSAELSFNSWFPKFKDFKKNFCDFSTFVIFWNCPFFTLFYSKFSPFFALTRSLKLYYSPSLGNHSLPSENVLPLLGSYFKSKASTEWGAVLFSSVSSAGNLIFGGYDSVSCQAQLFKDLRSM